jgi:hypothetical protein
MADKKRTSVAKYDFYDNRIASKEVYEKNRKLADAGKKFDASAVSSYEMREQARRSAEQKKNKSTLGKVGSSVKTAMARLFSKSKEKKKPIKDYGLGHGKIEHYSKQAGSYKNRK